MHRLTATLALALTSAFCFGSDGKSVDLELIDSETGLPVADAVVLAGNGADQEAINAEIVQKNREFQPHTLVVPKNSAIDFPNRDNTQHHVYSFSPAKIFDIELYAGRPEEPVVFDQAGIVELGCNIHDNMQAFILVTDTAPAGRTNAQGRLSVELAPPGSGSEERSGIVLRVWHPDLKDNTRLARFALEQPYPDTISLSVELSPQPASNDRFDSLQERFREL